jgi:hypothetical protein
MAVAYLYTDSKRRFRAQGPMVRSTVRTSEGLRSLSSDLWRIGKLRRGVPGSNSLLSVLFCQFDVQNHLPALVTPGETPIVSRGRFIVDTNPCRRGKHLLGSSKLIVAPNFMKKSVAPVIAMSLIYLDEIRSDLNSPGLHSELTCDMRAESSVHV